MGGGDAGRAGMIDDRLDEEDVPGDESDREDHAGEDAGEGVAGAPRAL